jgi:aminoglycoside phosphotransferase (APT) family kinase protein
VAAALSDLRDRFVDIYDLTPSQQTTLDGHLERIATADALPQVFQHGDPGTWNVLVTGDGRPVFLDWEAFERRGIPLWDAFYFARSHAVTVARAAGTRDALDAVRQSWLQDAPPVRELTGHIDEHCARIGLARDLVEPLFATCWMHRALKEAARLTPGRLQRGHYASLLRLSLDHRDVPGLRRLFATS